MHLYEPGLLPAARQGAGAKRLPSEVRERGAERSDERVYRVNMNLINSFRCHHFDRRVWVVETDPFAYRNALTRANQCADRRVRLAWHSNFVSALDFWHNVGQRVPMFAAVIGTELLAQLQDEQVFGKFSQMLENGAHFATVEVLGMNKTQGIDDKKLKATLDLLRSHFEVDEQIEHLENGINLLVIKATKLQSFSSKSYEDGMMEKCQKRHLLMGGF
ncbi:hypothetical protein niasHT_012449 [Heterodera trifolii]|uniref:Uncharacterized protein n=1 Tax=Heterodera trifolii TaxID=157864 RepID=A0ABD2L3J2_9BILA